MASSVQTAGSKQTTRLRQQIESLKNILNRIAPDSISGELTSAIAHEINNPVFAILNYLELAADELDRTHPIQQHLAEAVSQAEFISNLVRNLQCMNRADASSPEPFDPLQAVQSIASLMQKQLLKDGIELVQKYAHQTQKVFGVKGKLMRVVVDLCNNARRALKNSDSGKVEIRTSQSDEGCFQFAVEDYGIGLGNHNIGDLLRAMTSFWEPPGAGMGLYRTKKCVQSFHGTIILTNAERHEGAVVTIELPPFNNLDVSY